MKRFIALAAIAAFACAAHRAHACSLSEDFFKPSNFELVQIADAIVIATPLSQDARGNITTVGFAVDGVLKGEPIERFDATARLGDVQDVGSIGQDDIENWSTDREGCERTTFVKGKKYVLFLERSPRGGYSLLPMLLSRTGEEYYGADSPWVRTIKNYLDIQRTYAPMEQLDVLEKKFEKKRKGVLTPLAILEARDILRHLTQRTPWKPTPYLLATYEAFERGQEPKYGLDIVTIDAKGRSIDRVTGKPTTLTPEMYQRDLEDEKAKIMRALVLGDHPSAASLFEPAAASANPLPDKLGNAIRFFAKNDQLRRAYGLIEAKAANMLAVLSPNEAVRLLRDVQVALTGERAEFGEERWRSDAYVSSNWPELALRLYWQGFHLGIAAQWPDGAIRDIAFKTYRDRPLLTRALAARHDDKVVAWAIAEIADEAKRTAWESARWDQKAGNEDPAALPLEAIVLTYRADADAALHKAVCQSRNRRALVMQTLGMFGDGNDTRILGRIAMMPALDENERELLGVAFAQLFARGPIVSYFAPEYEMLKQTIRGEPVVHIGETLTPLACPPPSAPSAAR